MKPWSIKQKLSDLGQAWAAVFGGFVYLALSLLAGLAILFAATWLPNASLIRYSLFSENISLVRLLAGTIGFFTANTTAGRAVIVIIVAALSGINFAMFVFYAGRRIGRDRAAGLGIFGTIIGFMGVGCAACGSVIITSIFGLGAASGFLGLLPFQGIEFGIAGIIFLCISIVLLAGKINNPDICKIKRS